MQDKPGLSNHEPPQVVRHIQAWTLRGGMGWHSFKRFRNSWLWAPAQRCQEDLRKFWLAHKPKEMGELYSALREDLPTRLAEAERVGYGFVLPREVVPNVPRKALFVVTRKNPAIGILLNGMTETLGV